MTTTVNGTTGVTTTGFLIPGYATTATAAGTTTLTSSSTQQQYFTGSTTQTVVLPVTSTLTLGQSFRIVNSSSGVVTVQSSGLNTIIAMVANSEALYTVILTSGTSASSWQADYTGFTAVTGTGSNVLATSPQLTTPALGTPSSGTLTSCTGLPVAGGGTGVATATAYAVLCGGTTATGALQSIAGVGTAAQVLTSNGAGALPTFQTASAALILISTTSFSAVSAQSFNNCFSATYTNYLIKTSNFTNSASVDINLRYRVGGVDNTGSNYKRAILQGGGSTASSGASTIVAQIRVAYVTAGVLNSVGNLDINAPFATAHTTLNTMSLDASEPNAYVTVTASAFNATTSFDGFTIYPDSGTMSGTISIYGYTK